MTIERIHASEPDTTDRPPNQPDAWWCYGRFNETPDRHIGTGHASAPNGFPVHDCLTCGEPLFINYPEPIVPGVNAR